MALVEWLSGFNGISTAQADFALSALMTAAELVIRAHHPGVGPQRGDKASFVHRP